MSTDQLEQRLAAVEQALADLNGKIAPPAPAAPPKKWWERVGRPMTPEQRQTFDEVMAYGRYFRVTGQAPPPDWKPGDLIPEPEVGP